jgi:pimeloyl-ACP methyl ester carboxylesterase
VFVDQSPLQNYTSDGDWGLEQGNKSCNSAASLAHLQATLKYRPEDVYNGMISSCLGYLSHPQFQDDLSSATIVSDQEFFVSIARKGDAEWFGKLMADHTSLDWRTSIKWNFGVERGAKTRVLVIASNRSGCFPPEGPLYVVRLVNSETFWAGDEAGEDLAFPAEGVTIDWGGHWCYYEDPEKFNALVLDFLSLQRIP